MTNERTIVVGYDGSDEAKTAVRWAAKLAAQRNCPLQVVHCSLWILVSRDQGPVPGIEDSGLERAAQKVLDEGVGLAKETAPGLVDIEGTLLHGMPRDHFAAISKGAHMLVLGSRGIGGFLGLLVGSVSLEMAATAECPVAVIRADHHPEGRIVVAIDETGSPAALDDACAVAEATGADLHLVHVMHEPSGYRLLREPIDVHQAGEALLESAVLKARGQAPNITVTGELLTDASASRAIIEASRDARLTVVGTKGHGLIKGTIGSTAHAVLHHAKGPVLVSRRSDQP